MPKTKVRISKARGLDILHILKIGKEYHEEAKSWSIFEFDSDIAATNLAIAVEDPYQEIFIASVGKIIVGFMWCSLGNTVFSRELVGKDLFTYVKPSLRGRGVGKELALHFEDWAAVNNVKVIITGANSGIRDNSQASAMYENLGYHSFGLNFIKVL